MSTLGSFSTCLLVIPARSSITGGPIVQINKALIRGSGRPRRSRDEENNVDLSKLNSFWVKAFGDAGEATTMEEDVTGTQTSQTGIAEAPPREVWSEVDLVEFYVETEWIDLRKVLDYLIDRPDQPVSGRELAVHLGVTGEQFRGVMGGPSQRLRRWPFESRRDFETGQTIYTLPRREAEVLQTVRIVLSTLKHVRLVVT